MAEDAREEGVSEVAQQRTEPEHLRVEQAEARAERLAAKSR